MKEILVHADMLLTWHLTDLCNFNCNYCWKTSNNEKADNIPIDKIMKRLEKIDKTIIFIFTGGEPFFISNFVEFLVEIQKRHFIKINTNLSIKKQCNKFIEEINPERVIKIMFSPHVLERERRKESLEELCILVNKFQEKGFSMIGNYPVYPPLFKRLESDMQLFKLHNITVQTNLYHGVYNNINYPIDNNRISLSAEEISALLEYNHDALKNLNKSKGKQCPAGSICAMIGKDNIIPCLGYRDKVLGNIFDEHWKLYDRQVSCPSEYCFCAFKDMVIYPSHKGDKPIFKFFV